MATPVVGILTLYLNNRKALEERPVYEKMIEAARRIGLRAFVFTPQDVDDDGGRIHALIYRPDTRKWSRRWVKFPHVIYDRCRIQKSARFQQLLAFRKKYGHLTFLNRPMRNKWTVYRTLGKIAEFRSHLPQTRLYQSYQDVAEMLRRHPLLYLKPINGTGGRGIVRIDKLKDGRLLVQGRDHSRRIVPPKKVRKDRLAASLRRWNMHATRYVVQQGLNIRLPNGRVHDYRMLVQKNGRGEWEVTGCAGRVGPPNSITSNLHGGGKAVSMNRMLRQWIGSEAKIAQVRQTAERLGIGVARHLESSFGALCELALDLAIDRGGSVWLLEVNPKPSREVFIRAGESDTYRKAISRPMEYALWLYRQKRAARNRERLQQSEHRSSLSAGSDASYARGDDGVSPPEEQESRL
jgi:hypothetical protein